MFGQLENAHEPYHSEEGERRARFGAGATHRRHDVDERHVVWNDRRHVDDVLEVAPEGEFGRRREEANCQLNGEPGCADCRSLIGDDDGLRHEPDRLRHKVAQDWWAISRTRPRHRLTDEVAQDR